jgi:predicted O-methyltransferase YrrM
MPIRLPGLRAPLNWNHFVEARELGRELVDSLRAPPWQQLTRFERVLVRRPHLITPGLIACYAAALANHNELARFSGPHRKSMLHPETLLLLRLFGLASRAQAVEIGPYIGGSSIAVASGIRERGGPPLISIEHGGRETELGGIYREHPDLPSANIIADLRSNIAAAGLTSFVDVIEGRSDDPGVITALGRRLQGSIDLVVIDADGEVGRDLAMLQPWLAPGCLLVIDDYTAPGNPRKQDLIRRFIDQQVAGGALELLAVSGWGTWFGRLSSRARHFDPVGQIKAWRAARRLKPPSARCATA